MAFNNITKKHILNAIAEIDKYGVPANRKSTKYNLRYDGKLYPPKYILSIANKYANGKEKAPTEFSGGEESNNYLVKLGFEINIGSQPLIQQKKKKKKRSATVITTAIIESKNKFNNKSRYRLLEKILNKVEKESDVIVLPGGFLKSRNLTQEVIKEIENNVVELLTTSKRNLVVCLGLDANGNKHQLGVAISKDGVLAIGRKFYPAKKEKNTITIANSPNEREFGYSRTFKWKSKNYFIAVCYDSFGIKNKNLAPQNIDIIVDLIHGFRPVGEGRSGDVYFSKHGLAGASRQWECPSFGSAVFFDRTLPPNWQSGILWTKGEMSTRDWKYDDNPLKPSKVSEVEFKSEKAILRLFKVNANC